MTWKLNNYVILCKHKCTTNKSSYLKITKREKDNLTSTLTDRKKNKKNSS
jgi:hypothetical protein